MMFHKIGAWRKSFAAKAAGAMMVGWAAAASLSATAHAATIASSTTGEKAENRAAAARFSTAHMAEPAHIGLGLLLLGLCLGGVVKPFLHCWRVTKAKVD